MAQVVVSGCDDMEHRLVLLPSFAFLIPRLWDIQPSSDNENRKVRQVRVLLGVGNESGANFEAFGGKDVSNGFEE